MGNDDQAQDCTVVLETGPAFGTVDLNADGSFTYSPPVTGDLTFTYTLVCDGESYGPATVTVHAAPCPPPPPPPPGCPPVYNPDTGSPEGWCRADPQPGGGWGTGLNACGPGHSCPEPAPGSPACATILDCVSPGPEGFAAAGPGARPWFRPPWEDEDDDDA